MSSYIKDFRSVLCPSNFLSDTMVVSFSVSLYPCMAIALFLKAFCPCYSKTKIHIERRKKENI